MFYVRNILSLSNDGDQENKRSEIDTTTIRSYNNCSLTNSIFDVLNKKPNKYKAEHTKRRDCLLNSNHNVFISSSL